MNGKGREVELESSCTMPSFGCNSIMKNKAFEARLGFVDAIAVGRGRILGHLQ